MTGGISCEGRRLEDNLIVKKARAICLRQRMHKTADRTMMNGGTGMWRTMCLTVLMKRMKTRAS